MSITKKRYDVQVKFSVVAEDVGDAARKIHDFIPDTKGNIKSWVVYEVSAEKVKR